MAIKVTLSNASQVTRRTPTVQDVDTIKMSRATYQKLGSLLKNKELIIRGIDGSITGGTYTDNELIGEYRRILDELNDLYIKRYYPELGKDIVIKDGIVELDEYLGTLGVGIDYPYAKDTLDIPAWLHVDSQTEYRILVDSRDNTYLTTNNGTEVLVVYT